MTLLPVINSRYRLLDLLGEGGMGAVYRALDRLTGDIVALKRVTVTPSQIEFTSTTNQDPALALAQEFETLSSLRHPHIITVRDYGFDAEQHPFFTMDWLEHAQTIVAAGRGRPVEYQLHLLQQLLLALMYLHRRGMVHRDLKPDNVLVVQGVVKVLDLGLSIAMERAEGTPVGSLAYMAPELLDGQPASVASDLYAVGAIAYELLAGHHPFDVGDVSRLIDQVLVERPDLAVIDHPAAAVLGRLLAKDPRQRYGDAAMVIRVLGATTEQDFSLETTETRESFLQAAKFVGRETELQQLTDALSQAASGQGSAWLIGGESGVGKSRLVDELRARALVRGLMVLHGRAVEGGGLPYQLWRNVLPSLVLDADLSERTNWTFASEMPFCDTVPDKDLDWFGVPFYPVHYPQGECIAPGRYCAPIGWLETNVVQFQDPHHSWHDPTGRTFHLWARAHTGGTGFACILKVTEQGDRAGTGEMVTSFETAPSGKTMLYVPCPGGQMKFHVLYDDVTRLYWLLSTQATDSMCRADRLPPGRYNLPNNERRRLQLHFSRNMIDWCFAGLVAVGPCEHGSRHYASMAIDGEDLYVLSRSGDERAKTAHDGNLITFHALRDFRRLVY